MDELWMLTIDGTSSGEYENAAESILFKTYDEAETFVRTDFLSNVTNRYIGSGEVTEDDISAKIEETCHWHGLYEAQYRDGNAITDYKIEKVKIPS